MDLTVLTNRDSFRDGHYVEVGYGRPKDRVNVTGVAGADACMKEPWLQSRRRGVANC